MSCKVVVDYELCEANAKCMRIAPEIFKVDENDDLHILVDRVPDQLHEKVEEAVRRCPRQALSLEES